MANICLNYLANIHTEWLAVTKPEVHPVASTTTMLCINSAPIPGPIVGSTAPPTSSPSYRARLPGAMLTRPTSPPRTIPPSQPTISGCPTSSPSSSCWPKLPTLPGRDILRTISSHKSLEELQQTRTRPTTGQPSVALTGQPRPGWEGNREKGTRDPR